MLKILANAKSASNPKTTPRRQLIKATTKSSVRKYPKIRLFGQPAAFINPISRVFWDIIAKTRKEANIAPKAKNRMLVNSKKREKIVEKPIVSFSSAVDNIPKPVLSLNRRRKSAEPTHNVKLTMVRLV